MRSLATFLAKSGLALGLFLSFSAAGSVDKTLCHSEVLAALQNVQKDRGWNSLGDLFNLASFFSDESCYQSERDFAACIHQAEQLLSFFPGNKILVPSVALADFAGARVAAEFQSASLINISVLRKHLEKNDERVRLASSRALLDRWVSLYRQNPQAKPVRFEDFLKWVFKQPFYRRHMKNLDAVVANANLSISFDPHTRYVPRTQLEASLAPDPVMANHPMGGGYVFSQVLAGNREVGRVWIRNFGDRYSPHTSPSEEVKTAVTNLLKSGVKGIILDLRGNGGGSVDEAAKVANLFSFLSPEKGMVRLKRFFENGAESVFPQNIEDPLFANIPLVLLVDATTASAGELLAAALQDYGRAFTVGDRTYGKGTGQVQQSIDVEPGVIILRTAMQGILPSGTSNYLFGVYPDIDSQEWGAHRQYEGEPLREIDSVMYPPDLPAETVPPRTSRKPSDALTACLRKQRALRGNAHADSEVTLAADVLACTMNH